MKINRREFVTAAAAAVTLGPSALSSLANSAGKPSCPEHFWPKYPEWRREIWRQGNYHKSFQRWDMRGCAAQKIKWEEIEPGDVLLVGESLQGEMSKVETWWVSGVLQDQASFRKYNPPGNTQQVVQIKDLIQWYEYRKSESKHEHYARLYYILEGGLCNEPVEAIASVGDANALGKPSGEFMRVPNLITLAYHKYSNFETCACHGYFRREGFIEPGVTHKDWPEQFARIRRQTLS